MNYADRIASDTAAIYLFHGVIEKYENRVRNYNRKHIDVVSFRRVLTELRAAGAPVSMDEVRDAAQGLHKLPPGAFAITFDDGFANNLHVAAPVLLEMGIPATFYITTDFIDRNRMPWIDRIEWAVEQLEQGSLKLPWGERNFATDEQRIGLLDEMRAMIKTDPMADGNALASDVQRQLGFPQTYVSDHPLDRKLTWSEVSQLAGMEGFTVGGHSHTHPILSYLDHDKLETEIATSLSLLKGRSGIEVSHYAYPEGLSYCYSDTVIAALKRHGITCCPSAEDGVNSFPADPFRLKRVFVI